MNNFRVKVPLLLVLVFFFFFSGVMFAIIVAIQPIGASMAAFILMMGCPLGIAICLTGVIEAIKEDL